VLGAVRVEDRVRHEVGRTRANVSPYVDVVIGSVVGRARGIAFRGRRPDRERGEHVGDVARVTVSSNATVTALAERRAG
jgi:hypothetical protein